MENAHLVELPATVFALHHLLLLHPVVGRIVELLFLDLPESRELLRGMETIFKQANYLHLRLVGVIPNQHLPLHTLHALFTQRVFPIELTGPCRPDKCEMLMILGF